MQDGRVDRIHDAVGAIVNNPNKLQEVSDHLFSIFSSIQREPVRYFLLFVRRECNDKSQKWVSLCFLN